MDHAHAHLRGPVTEGREAIGSGSIIRRSNFEIINFAARADVKRDRFAADQGQRFHLVEILAELAKQKGIVIDGNRQVFSFVRA